MTSPHAITYTFEQMLDFVLKNPDLRDELGIDETDDRDENFDQIKHLALSAAPRVYDYLSSAANFNVFGDRIEFVPHQLPAVDALAALISNEYDSDCDIMWKLFELGGDDDVDYNGSYLIFTTDVLQKMYDTMK